MIKLEKTETYGWELAIRGMRNPLNSWNKSDSYQRKATDPDYKPDENNFVVGTADLDLMRRLRASGTDHAKFMRQIGVGVDITAPLYWWKEFDTYKVGTVANSTSTMHTLHKKEFTLDDFSCEDLGRVPNCDPQYFSALENVIDVLNEARHCYLYSKNKDYWRQMVQLLPSSYNQLRTITLNYQVLQNMYHARKNHKLDEWHVFCDWVESLPHSELITGVGL